jgi:dethiobiotin synthetase
MSAVFVAGAGTDVGKTHVAATLIRRMRDLGQPIQAIKPLVSGFDPHDWARSDPGRLLAALGEAPSPAALDALSPWRYRAPLAPDMAAAREGAVIDAPAVFAYCRARMAAAGEAPLFIEGVGGVMSPIAPDLTNLDWMRALGCPVLLVGGSYLGAISHMLTAAEVITAAGLTLAAAVVSESATGDAPFDETLASLGRLSPAPIIGAPRNLEVHWPDSVLACLGWMTGA